MFKSVYYQILFSCVCHVKAKNHAASMIREQIRELNWEAFGHPPYLPDLAPIDYRLIWSPEYSIRNKKFQNVNSN